MKLVDVLDFKSKELASIIGAGGKTTLMFQLSKELKHCKKSVLVTTTTAIYYPEEEQYDELFLLNGENDFNEVQLNEGKLITVIGNNIFNGNKLKGIDKTIVDNVYGKNKFDYILVEADGAKRKPIKAPDYYEPVIPLNTTLAIGVIGMDSFDREINNENVHRPDIFTKVTQSNLNQKIDVNIIKNLVIHRQGLFKDNPEKIRKYLILNKVEDEYRLHFAKSIAKSIRMSGYKIDKIIITSLINEKIVEVM